MTNAGIPIDSLSEYQQAVFEDGEVSADEDERAVLDTVACLQAKGVRAEAVLQSDDTYAVAWEIENGLESDFEDAYRVCEDEYLSAVELGWADALGSDALTGSDWDEAVNQCLRDHGFKVTGEPDEIANIAENEPELYVECGRAASGLDP